MSKEHYNRIIERLTGNEYKTLKNVRQAIGNPRTKLSSKERSNLLEVAESHFAPKAPKIRVRRFNPAFDPTPEDYSKVVAEEDAALTAVETRLSNGHAPVENGIRQKRAMSIALLYLNDKARRLFVDYLTAAKADGMLSIDQVLTEMCHSLPNSRIDDDLTTEKDINVNRV